MPNLRGKTWTTTTPANVGDAQYWEDHLISDEAAAKAASSVQTVNSTPPDASGNVDVVALPSGGTLGQVLTKQSSADGDADWEDPASSGHTIQDEDGIDMPYQDTLQFVNAEVTNDTVNEKTVVDCKGAKGDPGPQGPQGPQGEVGATGPQGPQGVQGDAATITVGTVTTLPAGSQATVNNSGTSGAAVFDFGIPKGADGSGSGDMAKAEYATNGETGVVDEAVTLKGLTASIADLNKTSSLATVATTGAYSDLSGKPTLATVATSGSYNDLSNKPTIPAAQVNADWNANSGVAEILNKPTIPTITDTYSATSSDGMSGKAVASAISDIADVVPDSLDDLTDVDITGTPSQGETLIANSSGIFENQPMPQGGHTMLPTPDASLTEAQVVMAVNAAKGTDDNVPSLFSIQKWSNVYERSIEYTGTVNATGIGTWQDDISSATQADEISWGWWYNDAFKIPDNADNIKLDISYDPSTNEAITLGGWELDTTTGYLCIKFGNEITDTTNARVFVDLMYQRNDY